MFRIFVAERYYPDSHKPELSPWRDPDTISGTFTGALTLGILRRRREGNRGASGNIRVVELPSVA